MKTVKTMSWRKLKNAVKLLSALLIIPLIAWIAEFVYSRYITPAPPPQLNPKPHALERTGNGYDYDLPFSLIRKYRRMQKVWITKPHEFIDDVSIKDQLDRLHGSFETEQVKFITYYYNIQERFRGSQMPTRMRRRLRYYRTVLRNTIGNIERLQSVFDKK